MTLKLKSTFFLSLQSYSYTSLVNLATGTAQNRANYVWIGNESTSVNTPSVIVKMSPSQLSSHANHPRFTSIQRLRKLSRLLDNAIAIPGTPFRFGLDPILGLIPGAGDFIGTALSAYIVIEAARLGMPRATLGKMVGNILLECLVGTIPIVGDWFDFAWKANTKNMELLETHVGVSPADQKANRWFIALLVLGLFVLAIGLVAFSVLVIRLLLNAVTS